jgi:uncharacterized protein YjiS (DUF1127 family)
MTMMRKSLAAGESSRIYLDRCIWNIHQYALIWQARVQKWHQNIKTRKHLANLPPHLYQDIGLTDRQVRHEIQKKFWQ